MMLRIRDADTGESDLQVVPVPEGFSFQMALADTMPLEGATMVSCIVSRADAARLVDFLRANG